MHKGIQQDIILIAWLLQTERAINIEVLRKLLCALRNKRYWKLKQKAEDRKKVETTAKENVLPLVV